MRAFQDTASELALLRRRMHHPAADAHAVEHERELLHTLTARRAEFVGLPSPDPGRARAGGPRSHPHRKTTVTDALAVSTRIGPELVDLRRALHRIPELGLHLPDTQRVGPRRPRRDRPRGDDGGVAQLGRRGAARPGAGTRASGPSCCCAGTWTRCR